MDNNERSYSILNACEYKDSLGKSDEAAAIGADSR